MDRFVITSNFPEENNNSTFDILSSYDKTTKKNKSEWSVKSIFQLLEVTKNLESRLNAINKKHSKFEKDFNDAKNLLNEVKTTNTSNSTKLNWLNGLTIGAIIAIVVALVGVAIGYYQFAYENRVTDEYIKKEDQNNILINAKLKEMQDKEKRCLDNSQSFYQYKQCANLLNFAN